MPNKAIPTILCAVILLLVVCGIYLIHTGNEKHDPTAAEDGGTVRPIHVENCRIADENGKTVQLTGMSSHGLLWYPEYTNANAMQTLKSYGANTFRIAIYSDDAGGGYVQQKEETMRLTYLAIENAISADMYVIVDWHVLRDENPLKNQESALAFFEEISSHYGDCPNLLYEICNEPNGDATWADISSYANAVIPVIRRNAPDAIVIVGTPSFSYSVEQVFDRPLEYENVMYSFHFYAGQFDDHYNEVFDLCEKNHIPVFVSEWGINHDDYGKTALSQGKTFVTVLNRRKISWIAWSLCNKNEVFSAIRSDCEKYSDWETDDLTDVGKIFFDAF